MLAESLESVLTNGIQVVSTPGWAVEPSRLRPPAPIAGTWRLPLGLCKNGDLVTPAPVPTQCAPDWTHPPPRDEFTESPGGEGAPLFWVRRLPRSPILSRARARSPNLLPYRDSHVPGRAGGGASEGGASREAPAYDWRCGPSLPRPALLWGKSPAPPRPGHLLPGLGVRGVAW